MLKIHLVASESSGSITTACGINGLINEDGLTYVSGKVAGSCGKGFIASRSSQFEPDKKACKKCIAHYESAL